MWACHQYVKLSKHAFHTESSSKYARVILLWGGGSMLLIKLEKNLQLCNIKFNQFAIKEVFLNKLYVIAFFLRFLIKMLIQGYRVSFIATMTHFTSKFAAFRGNCWLEFMRKAVPQHSTSIGKSSLWIVGDGRTANFFLEFLTQHEVISFRCISRDWRYSGVNPYRGLHIIIDMATSLWWVSFRKRS